MTKKDAFCEQLACWLFKQDWHFKTSLAVCIETVTRLPDDADRVIYRLLNEFPNKPRKEHIAEFLRKDVGIEEWFTRPALKPRIINFNLDVNQPSLLVNENLPRLDSINDLADWMNVSCAQLEWLVDLKRHDVKTLSYLNHYFYTFAKKRDGRLRLLESPKSLLKTCQRKIDQEILAYTTVHDAAHGFVRNRNCKTHSEKHVGQKYVYLFDLADCFHSVGWPPVYGVFRGLGYAQSIAKYLAALCTHKCYLVDELLSQLTPTQHIQLKQKHLPQGAPTSPSLSNAVLFGVDKRLAGLAKSLDLQYSRYADDMIFSGNVYKDMRWFEPLVGSICLEQGFRLNHRKSRLLKQHQRQKITGIVVNEKINIDRRYYDRLKAVLTNCARHGLNSQNRGDHPEFQSHLLGSIQHVRSLNQTKGEKLQKIFDRIR